MSLHPVCAIFLLLGFAIPFSPLSGSSISAQTIPIRPGTLAEPTLSPQMAIKRHQVSQQNLLTLDRSGPHRLPRSKPIGTNTVPRALRILAIRVDFPPDTSAQTTRNGQFDYRTPLQFEQQEGHFIDQSPHDRLYFERHLAAMRTYYQVASFGQLNLNWAVFPSGLTTAYTLPHEMAFYSPDVDFLDPLKIERLVAFVEDAFHAADQDTAITFADYDAYIFFHAGSDLQHDRLRNSPSDLQSGFLRIGDERSPILVDNGAKAIREMILMPETTSQDSNIGALNTTLTHEFGHQLGLPDLYSTFNFASAVGLFDLMDLESGTVDVGESGKQIVTGALPTGLSAWSRTFLGWLDPLEVVADSVNVGVLASWSASVGLKAIKITVAPGEYFLIENRETDLDGDGTAFLNFQDGIIVGPSNASKQPTREYDYLLPGSGVLIWHVDENVAFGDFNENGETNWVDNTLQWDERHRFLDVEEADGVQQLGFTTDPVRREDLFFVGNNALFGPKTSPDSRLYSGGTSSVTVRMTTDPRLVMGVQVIRAHTRAGWPVAIGSPAGNHAPVLVDIDGDQKLETFVVSSDGKLYAWRSDGTRVIDNTDSINTVSFTGDTVRAPAAVFADSAGVFFTDPAVADLDNDGMVDIVTTDAEQLYAWNPIDTNGDGRADRKPGFPVRLSQPATPGQGQAERVTLTAPTLIHRNGNLYAIVVGTTTGGIIVVSASGSVQASFVVTQSLTERLSVPPSVADLDGDGHDDLLVTLVVAGGGRLQAVRTTGQQLWSEPISAVDRTSTPLVADLNGDGSLDVVVAGGDGTVHAFDREGAVLPGWPTLLPSSIAAPPSIGDISGDGLPEIVFSGDNRLFALHNTGVPVTNFPIVIDRVRPVGVLLSSPVLGDVDGDGIADIVVGLPDGTVTAYRGDAQAIETFPFGTSGAITSTPALGDLTGTGEVTVVVLSNDGFAHASSYSGDSTVLPWPMLAHDPGRSGASTSASQPPVPGSGNLLVSQSAFCYPNPVTTGTTGIRYTLSRPADRVRIRVYTLDGTIVDEIEGTLYQQENEVRWAITRAPSGVYLCQVEARDPVGTQTVFFKIAVVK